MEDKTLKIEISVDKIKEGMVEAANELFKSSYSNPIKKILEKSIEEKDGEIKKIVNEIILEAIGNPEFKSKIADVVINNMVQSALRK